MKYISGRCTIEFDPERTDGRYHAVVHLSSKIQMHFVPEKRIEVTLNGDGRSKAKKKIRKQLHHYRLENNYIRFEDEQSYF